MKIWAFPAFYPYDHPGLKWNGIFAHRQYKALIANGADLSVVVPVKWHPPAPFHMLDNSWKSVKKLNYPKQTVYDGIPVYYPRIMDMKPSRVFSKPYQQRFTEGIINFFKSGNVSLEKGKDIFYAQWLPDAYCVHKAARALGVKSAILAIGDDINVWPFKNSETLANFTELWTEADQRFAVAGYLAQKANETAKRTDIHCNVIRRGVEHHVFKPAEAGEKMALRRKFGIPEDKLIIMNVGAPIRNKGWLDLIDVLSELRQSNPGIALLGVSAGYGEQNLFEVAKKHKFEDAFFNLGEIDPAEMKDVYKMADIFCLPSKFEGIANAVVEAMSSGVATITTDVGGHPELIEHGVTGLLIQWQNRESLYNALDKMINDEEARKKIAANGRAFIVNKWGSFNSNAASLYQKLLEM